MSGMDSQLSAGCGVAIDEAINLLKLTGYVMHQQV